VDRGVHYKISVLLLYQISNLSTHTQRGQAREYPDRDSLLVHSKHHTANMATLHHTMIMLLVLVVPHNLVPALSAKAKSRTIQSFFKNNTLAQLNSLWLARRAAQKGLRLGLLHLLKSIFEILKEGSYRFRDRVF
jgi:hypothetical protein